MADFSKMLAKTEKYTRAEEAYGVHGPPFALVALSALVVRERSLV